MLSFMDMEVLMLAKMPAAVILLNFVVVRMGYLSMGMGSFRLLKALHPFYRPTAHPIYRS